MKSHNRVTRLRRTDDFCGDEQSKGRTQSGFEHGFMCAWSFYDLDGHHWEVLWMDPKALA